MISGVWKSERGSVSVKLWSHQQQRFHLIITRDSQRFKCRLHVGPSYKLLLSVFRLKPVVTNIFCITQNNLQFSYRLFCKCWRTFLNGTLPEPGLIKKYQNFVRSAPVCSAATHGQTTVPVYCDTEGKLNPEDCQTGSVVKQSVSLPVRLWSFTLDSHWSSLGFIFWMLMWCMRIMRRLLFVWLYSIQVPGCWTPHPKP